VALMAHVDHICERGIAIEFSWPPLSWCKQFGVPFHDALAEGRRSTHQYLSVVNMWYFIKRVVFGIPIDIFRGM
jgi:hypothetical protein